MCRARSCRCPSAPCPLPSAARWRLRSERCGGRPGEAPPRPCGPASFPPLRPRPAAAPPLRPRPAQPPAPSQDEVPGAGCPPRTDGSQQVPGRPQQARAPGAAGRGPFARAHPITHSPRRSVCPRGIRLGLQCRPLPTPLSCPSRPRPPDQHLPGTSGEDQLPPLPRSPPCSEGGVQAAPPTLFSSPPLPLSPHAVLSRPCLGGSSTTGCSPPCLLLGLSMTCRYQVPGPVCTGRSCCHLCLGLPQPCPASSTFPVSLWVWGSPPRLLGWFQEGLGRT